MLLLIATVTGQNITGCFSSLQSVGGVNGTTFEMFDSIKQIKAGNLTEFNTTASVSIIRVCTNSTNTTSKDFIVGFKARLADNATGIAMEDS